MHKTRAEAVAYLAELRDWSRTSALDADIAIFPPFTALAAAAAQLDSSRRPATADRAGQPSPSLHLGAQNMHWQADGAQTGEISAEMLLDCGVSIVEARPLRTPSAPLRDRSLGQPEGQGGDHGRPRDGDLRR